jgi:hypothetical protein
MGCCGEPAVGCRGGTCRPSTGTGRPSTTGIAAGQETAPGFGSSTSCAATPTRAKAQSGRSGSTPGWSVPISTPLGPVTSPPLTSPRRSSRASSCTQGAGSNHKKSAGRPSREALGRSRGGLTSKIHLAADIRCRPISRVTTAGHRHDSLAFEPVMAGIRIRRRGRGRPRTRPGRVLGDKAYSSRAIRSHLRRRRITAVIPEPADQAGHRRRKGSRGGRPVAYDTVDYRQRNVVERFEPPRRVRRLSSLTIRPRRGRRCDGSGLLRARRVGCRRSARGGGGGCTSRPIPARRSRPARRSAMDREV